MGKSILTIHREIEKEEHAKSPLGQAERRIRDLHTELGKRSKEETEPLAKKIDELRSQSEKEVMAFVDECVEEDKKLALKRKKKGDEMLLATFKKEIKMIENYLSK